jgi:hypothetical protein
MNIKREDFCPSRRYTYELSEARWMGGNVDARIYVIIDGSRRELDLTLTDVTRQRAKAVVDMLNNAVPKATHEIVIRLSPQEAASIYASSGGSGVMQDLLRRLKVFVV